MVWSLWSWRIFMMGLLTTNWRDGFVAFILFEDDQLFLQTPRWILPNSPEAPKRFSPGVAGMSAVRWTQFLWWVWGFWYENQQVGRCWKKRSIYFGVLWGYIYICIYMELREIYLIGMFWNLWCMSLYVVVYYFSFFSPTDFGTEGPFMGM